MPEPQSDMSKSIKSLTTVRNSKKYLPSFYERVEKRKEKDVSLAWCMASVPCELLTVFDIHNEWPENFGTLCAARLVAPSFIERAESEGYSTDLCSYLTNSVGYCSRCNELGRVPPESPLADGMGNPNMLLGSGFACEPRWKWFQALATRYLKIPVFSSDPISPPYDMDLKDPRVRDHYLDHLRTDIKMQIRFLENFTGKKLDLDQFREVMKNSQEALRIWTEILEMRKSIPCPMGAEDYFSAFIPQMFMLGKKEAVDFYAALHAEVKDRVANKKGVIENEKFRLLWFGLPPWFNLGIFNYFEKLGAVFAVESSYNAGPYIDLDLTDPVEALVQRTWLRTEWLHRYGIEGMPEVTNPSIYTAYMGGGLVRRWVEEYRVDGAVMHRTRSCRASCVGQVHTKNELFKIGIPALIFESDMVDPRAWSDARIKSQIDAFLELIDSKRGGM